MDNANSGPRQLSWYHKQGNWGASQGPLGGVQAKVEALRMQRTREMVQEETQLAQAEGKAAKMAIPGRGDQGFAPPLPSTLTLRCCCKGPLMESRREQRRVSLQDKRTLGKKGRGVTANKPSCHHFSTHYQRITHEEGILLTVPRKDSRPSVPCSPSTHTPFQEVILPRTRGSPLPTLREEMRP